MEIQKYEIEKYIRDWHWHEASQAEAIEMGAFLFSFMDYLQESGLSAATVEKHERNT